MLVDNRIRLEGEAPAGGIFVDHNAVARRRPLAGRAVPQGGLPPLGLRNRELTSPGSDSGYRGRSDPAGKRVVLTRLDTLELWIPGRDRAAEYPAECAEYPRLRIDSERS